MLVQLQLISLASIFDDSVDNDDDEVTMMCRPTYFMLLLWTGESQDWGKGRRRETLSVYKKYFKLIIDYDAVMLFYSYPCPTTMI